MSSFQHAYRPGMLHASSASDNIMLGATESRGWDEPVRTWPSSILGCFALGLQLQLLRRVALGLRLRRLGRRLPPTYPALGA